MAKRSESDASSAATKPEEAATPAVAKPAEDAPAAKPAAADVVPVAAVASAPVVDEAAASDLPAFAWVDPSRYPRQAADAPLAAPVHVPRGDARLFWSRDRSAYVALYRKGATVVVWRAPVGKYGQWRTVVYPETGPAAAAYARIGSEVRDEGYDED